MKFCVKIEIKALMKRNHEQSTKEAASIIHLDDIVNDWEHLATHGGLADLSVAELNLYLTELCGMSVQETKKK